MCPVRWRLYPFKGEEQLEIVYIHRQSAFLIGRDDRVRMHALSFARDV